MGKGREGQGLQAQARPEEGSAKEASRAACAQQEAEWLMSVDLFAVYLS